VGSGSLKFVMITQAILGACTAVFIAASTRRWYGARAALIAGLAYGLYGPAVYIDTAILGEGLLLFLLTAALWAAWRDPLPAGFATLAGAALGAAAAVRPTALVIAGASVLWIARRHGVRPAAAAALACVVAIGPVIAKNWSSAGTLSIQGYGGLNAYIGNSPMYDGRATFRLGSGWDRLNAEATRAGAAEPMAQDRYYLAKLRREIAGDPLGYLRLLVRKALWLVQSEEPRDSHSYYFFTDRSVLLRTLPRWWLLFAFGAAGLVAAVRWRPPAPTLPLWYAAGAAASIVLLVVGFRYRMPLVPAVSIAAGVGVDAFASSATGGRRREMLAMAAACAAALAVSVVLSDPRNRNLAEEWAFTGSSLITERRLEDAEAAYRRALALDPQSGLAWDGLGLTLYDAGRLGEARPAFERALAIDADSSRALFHLALTDEREGRLAQAADGYARARALSPFDAEVTQHLAAAERKLAIELGMSGRSREALDAMRHVLDLTPRDGEAWLDVCLLSLDLHDTATAATALQRARELGAEPGRLAFAEQALARIR
jgi:tetratricopeptide (TPR) repeat protein